MVINKAVGSNGLHVQQQSNRISLVNKTLLQRAYDGVARRILKNKSSMPNRPWYRTVTKNGLTIGHIVGQGCFISSILASTMTPRGVRI